MDGTQNTEIRTRAEADLAVAALEDWQLDDIIESTSSPALLWDAAQRLRTARVGQAKAKLNAWKELARDNRGTKASEQLGKGRKIARFPARLAAPGFGVRDNPVRISWIAPAPLPGIASMEERNYRKFAWR